MWLETIILKNYFIHSNLKVSLKKINFFIGDSFSGKTSLLDGFNFLFDCCSFISSNNQKLIKKNEEYATIEGFFVVDNKRKKTQQKIHLFKNKTKFYVDYQTKDSFFENLFFVSGFFVDQKRNKLTENIIDKNLYHLYPSFKNKVEKTKKEHDQWKNLFSQKLNNDLFFDQEKKLAILHCQIIEIKQKFLKKVNQQIKEIIIEYFLNLIDFFSVFFTWNNCLVDDFLEKKLWNQVLEFLKKERTNQKTKIILKIKFSKPLKTLSENEQRIREFIFNVALLKIIQKESENKTIFLFDNLHFFDIKFQKIILQILQNFDQSIITSCYKDKKLDDIIFLPKKIYWLQKN